MALFQMKSIIRKIVNQLLSFVGLKVTRTGSGIFGSAKKLVRPAEESFKLGPSAEDKFKWIQGMGIKTVIDVGAHAGESARQFHQIFPDAMIYSFEPLHDCFVELNSVMKNVPDFKSFNLALGDKEGTLDIHRSAFSSSSSLLKMAKLHKEAFPFSSEETRETIHINTLDNVAKELDLEENILLKIDVQGYELKVIDGSKNILNKVKVIIVETSFRELYEGQPLFPEIYELLNRMGFVYSGSWGELKSPLDGATLQQDSIFIRNRLNYPK
jgi:FkbM family methyltransferase